MLQSRKSRELTVNFFSCGSYDLIWCNALHLTSIRALIRFEIIILFFKIGYLNLFVVYLLYKLLSLIYIYYSLSILCYMVLIYKYKSNMYIKLFKRSAGGAWLSSIRVLIRLVKSKNEWNPQVYFVRSLFF